MFVADGAMAIAPTERLAMASVSGVHVAPLFVVFHALALAALVVVPRELEQHFGVDPAVDAVAPQIIEDARPGAAFFRLREAGIVRALEPFAFPPIRFVVCRSKRGHKHSSASHRD